MAPSVSIIIPAYNAERYLQETVNAVLAQTVSDWQLVIVDDGSTDKTFELAQKIASCDPRISAVTQPNKGVSIARNSGLAAALTPSMYVIYLDADDVWLPDALEVLIAKIEESPAYVAAHGLGKFIDAESRDIRLGECEEMCRKRPAPYDGVVRDSRPEEPTTLEALIVSGCVVCPAAVLMKREVVETIGGFDPKFQVCADWDVYIRLARHGDFGYSDRVIIGYRQHANNMSGNSVKQREEQRQVIDGAMSSADNTPEQAKRIADTFRLAQRFFMRDKLKLAMTEAKHGNVKPAAMQLAYGVKHFVRSFSDRPYPRNPDAPFISILIPVYNGEQYLAETLESVAFQTYRKWEAIIIDDGSSDGSVALASQYVGRDSRFKIIEQANTGIAGARNRGISEASQKAKYLICLDHDDFWEPKALETLVDELEIDADAVGAYGLAKFVNEVGLDIRKGELEASFRDRLRLQNGAVIPLGEGEPTTFACLVVRNYMVTPGTVLFRKSRLDEVGMFDPSTVPCDDWDLYARMARGGYFIFKEEMILSYRLHSSNASLNSQQMRDSEAVVRKKLVASQENSPEQTALAKHTLLSWQKYLIRQKLKFARDAILKGHVVGALKQLAYCVKPIVQMIKGRM